MKLKLPQIIGIIAAIIILGAAAYFFTKGQNNLIPSDSNNGEEKSSVAGKLADIFNLGQNVTCTYSSPEGSGTMYVSGDRFRADFSTPDGMTGSVIGDKDYTYIWNSGMEQGYKMKNESESLEGDLEGNEASKEFFDPEQNVDYECKPWTVNSSMFQVPTDREFIDFSAQMEELQKNQGEAAPNLCASCESLEGEAKTACQAQFCN